MSGLCGWYGPPVADVLEQMASPICRFERTPLRSAANGRGALALCGSIDGASMVQDDGLLVAVWGAQAELVARLWRSDVVQACTAVPGQFALAIVDARRGEALLAVDRFASRPLYYQLSGETLVFATSQDAMLRHPLCARQVDPAALHACLVLQATAGSAYVGQQRLGPGEFLHLRAGRVTRRAYWRQRFDVQPATRATVSQLTSAFQSGVASAAGHQPTGVLLSGGAASAAIAAQLDVLSGAPVPTFAVGYAGAGADPLAAARHAARVVRSRHHEHLVGPADLVDAMPRLAAASDKPCVAPAAVALYHGAMLARAHGVLRVLSGHGLAEQFGAGALHARHAQLARYARLPAALRQLVIEPLLQRMGASATAYAALRDAPARIEHDSRAAVERLDPALLAQVDPDAPYALLRAWWWGAQTRSAANRTIALDIRLGLFAQRLPAVLAGCALAGVDVAFPFLDEGVAAQAARLDPACKGRGRRALHAAALRAMVPGSLAPSGAAPALPLASWLRADTALHALVFDSIADLRMRHVVRRTALDAVLSTPLDAPPPGFGLLAWQLAMLEQWFAQRASHQRGAATALPVAAGRMADVAALAGVD